jgi:hypothetical protein
MDTFAILAPALVGGTVLAYSFVWVWAWAKRVLS